MGVFIMAYRVFSGVVPDGATSTYYLASEIFDRALAGAEGVDYTLYRSIYDSVNNARMGRLPCEGSDVFCDIILDAHDFLSSKDFDDFCEYVVSFLYMNVFIL